MIFDIPYVPSSDARLKIMLELAGVKPGDRAIDLGSGDGKVIIALAKLGADVDGYEIDSGRFLLSEENIMEAQLTHPPKIYNENFWKAKLGDYDLIVLYGITSIMERLEKKILAEAKIGTRIVSNYFQFPNLKPQVSKDEVHLYVIDS